MATLPKKVFRLKAKELRKQVTTLEDTGFVEDLRADDQSGGLIPGMGSLTDGPELLVDIIDGIINDITGLVDPYAAIKPVTDPFSNSSPIPVSQTINQNAGLVETVDVKPILPGLNDILKQGSIRTALTVDQVLKGFIDQDPKIYEVLVQFTSKDRLDYLRSEYIAAFAVNTNGVSLNYTGQSAENLKGSLALISELTNNKFIYEIQDIAALRTLYGNLPRNISFFSGSGIATATMQKVFDIPGYNIKALFSEIMKNAVINSDAGLMLEMALYLNQQDDSLDKTGTYSHPTTKTTAKRALLTLQYAYMQSFFSGYKFNPKTTLSECVIEYIRIDSIMNLSKPIPDEINTCISIRNNYPPGGNHTTEKSFYPLGWACLIAAQVSNDVQASDYLALLNSDDPLPDTPITLINQKRKDFLEIIYQNKLNLDNWRLLYKKGLFPNVTNWLDLLNAAYERELRLSVVNAVAYDWKAYLDEYYALIAGDWKLTGISAEYRRRNPNNNVSISDYVSSGIVPGPFYSPAYMLETKLSDAYKNITNSGILQIFANYGKFIKDQKVNVNLDVSDTLSGENFRDLIPVQSYFTNINEKNFVEIQSKILRDISFSYPFIPGLPYKPIFSYSDQFIYLDAKGNIVYPNFN